MIKKIYFHSLIFLLSILTNGCLDNSGNEYLNLDFESVSVPGTPWGWAVRKNGYDVKIDRKIYFSGSKSVKIKKVSNGRFGSITLSLPAYKAAGKHLSYSGYIKSENIKKGFAGLWIKIDGKKSNIFLDDMQDRGITGTTDWKKYTIEMDVPENAALIMFGAAFSGEGIAWFDNLEIKINGKKYIQDEPELFVPSEKELAQLKKSIITFDSPEPAEDNRDLLPLKQEINNAEIISLGEATHGTSEFFKMKHKIIKFTAEQKKKIVFAIEANMPECKKINEYILTGKGNSREALKGIYFWTWYTQEVLDMIEWMREFNASGKGRIEFWGFDMQIPAVALKNIEDFVTRYDPAYLKTFNEHHKNITDNFETIKKNGKLFNKALVKTWSDAAQNILKHLKINRSKYLSLTEEQEVDFVIQDARIVFQGASSILQEKSRDKSMALNARWIKQQFPDDYTMIIWAHNGHVNKRENWMGYYLDEIYGDKMLVFGFAFHSGKYVAKKDNVLSVYGTSDSEPGSIEWAFHKTGIKRGILDLRKTENFPWMNKNLNFRTIGSMAMDYAFSTTIITRDFDFLIYFDQTTASNCFRLNDKLQLH